MDLTLLLQIVQIIVAILLIVVVLMQQKGAGLGGIFGGASGGNAFSSKRGLDKTLHVSTIVLAIIFLGVAILNVVL